MKKIYLIVNSIITNSYTQLIFISVIVLIFIKIISIVSQKKKERKQCDTDLYEHTIGDADNDIQKYFPDMTEQKLLDILYEKFIEVQKSWMNFDYNTLEKLCTNELYNSYKSDLEILKLKNNQNIISNFNLIYSNINGIIEENNIISIKMFLHVSFYDYVIDTKSEEVIRGDKERIAYNQYILTFVTKKTKDSMECPSCGAKINNESSDCEYCHTIINNNYGNFVLSSKEKI